MIQPRLIFPMYNYWTIRHRYPGLWNTCLRISLNLVGIMSGLHLEVNGKDFLFWVEKFNFRSSLRLSIKQLPDWEEVAAGYIWTGCGICVVFLTSCWVVPVCVVAGWMVNLPRE